MLGAFVRICRSDNKALFFWSPTRFQSAWIWGAFALIGHNCQVKVEQLQHAMLDQRIDRAEKELEEESGKELLNLKSAIPHGEGGRAV